ncbi:MAG TPA: hypothetical protein VLH12_08475 [Usitatibacter sp.]|nr:hypothetical protein [Usitatibacter sp.]
MLDLDLDKVTATLEHLNTRTEKSGPDDVPAATVKVSCAQSADVLAYFSPELRGFLFDTEGPKDLAGGMSIRNPHLEYPIGLDHEMTGATVMVEYGVSKPIEFSDCTVNNFKITPMEGGTVVLGFQVHCKPDEKQIGKLYLLQKKGITLTIEPAELPAMKDAA